LPRRVPTTRNTLDMSRALVVAEEVRTENKRFVGSSNANREAASVHGGTPPDGSPRIRRWKVGLPDPDRLWPHYDLGACPRIRPRQHRDT
jgi:hypothetical protein